MTSNGFCMWIAVLALAMVCASTEGWTQPFATIEIYKASVGDVCGSRSYVDADSCPVTAATYNDLRRRGRLQLAYQTSPIPPDVNPFSVDLIADSRRMSDFTNGTSGLAALLVVNWIGRAPRSIEVTRSDPRGNSLGDSKPFRRELGRGRFFYHFPYEQVSRVVLTLTSTFPSRQITYHP
jgi:hypothetical protein